MLNSMTGFARETADTNYGTITCELRAVNHRFLDFQFRLPEELRPHEPAIRTLLGDALGRGKIECSVYLKRTKSVPDELQINDELVRAIAAKASEVRDAVKDCGPLNAIDVLRWPGVVSEPDIEAEPLFEATRPVLDAALSALIEMRASEGKRISAMIETRLQDVAAIADSREDSRDT